MFFFWGVPRYPKKLNFGYLRCKVPYHKNSHQNMSFYGHWFLNTSQDSMHLISAKTLSREWNLLENSFELLFGKRRIKNGRYLSHLLI